MYMSIRAGRFGGDGCCPGCMCAPPASSPSPARLRVSVLARAGLLTRGLTQPPAALYSTAGDGARAVKVTDIYSGAVIQATRSGGAELVTVYFEDSGVSLVLDLQAAIGSVAALAGVFAMWPPRAGAAHPGTLLESTMCDAPSHAPRPARRCARAWPRWRSRACGRTCRPTTLRCGEALEGRKGAAWGWAMRWVGCQFAACTRVLAPPTTLLCSAAAPATSPPLQGVCRCTACCRGGSWLGRLPPALPPRQPRRPACWGRQGSASPPPSP